MTDQVIHMALAVLLIIQFGKELFAIKASSKEVDDLFGVMLFFFWHGPLLIAYVTGALWLASR